MQSDVRYPPQALEAVFPSSALEEALSLDLSNRDLLSSLPSLAPGDTHDSIVTSILRALLHRLTISTNPLDRRKHVLAIEMPAVRRGKKKVRQVSLVGAGRSLNPR